MGNIKSLDRYIKKKNNIVQFKKGKSITLIKNSDGYFQCKLCKNGKSHTKRVHRIVGEAFLEVPSSNNRFEINHKDCNRQNNCVENLEWVTHYNNIKYSIDQKHHICTTNLTGKNNPNYGNHILHERYKSNPLLAIEKLARKGKVNGSAQKIELYDINMNYVCSFDWIGGCAEYLISHNLTKSSVNAIRDRIGKSIRENKPYLKHYYKHSLNKDNHKIIPCQA